MKAKNLISVLFLLFSIFLSSELLLAQVGECREDFGGINCNGRFDDDNIMDTLIFGQGNNSSYTLELITKNSRAKTTWKKPWELVIADFNGDGISDIFAIDNMPETKNSEIAKMVPVYNDYFQGLKISSEVLWKESNSNTAASRWLFSQIGAGYVSPVPSVSIYKKADLVVYNEETKELTVRSNADYSPNQQIVSSIKTQGFFTKALKIVKGSLLRSNLDLIALVNYEHLDSSNSWMTGNNNTLDPDMLGRIINEEDSVCITYEDSYSWNSVAVGNCSGIITESDEDWNMENSNSNSFGSDEDNSFENTNEKFFEAEIYKMDYFFGIQLVSERARIYINEAGLSTGGGGMDEWSGNRNRSAYSLDSEKISEEETDDSNRNCMTTATNNNGLNNLFSILIALGLVALINRKK